MRWHVPTGTAVCGAGMGIISHIDATVPVVENVGACSTCPDASFLPARHVGAAIAAARFGLPRRTTCETKRLAPPAAVKYHILGSRPTAALPEIGQCNTFIAHGHCTYIALTLKSSMAAPVTMHVLVGVQSDAIPICGHASCPRRGLPLPLPVPINSAGGSVIPLFGLQPLFQFQNLPHRAAHCQ